ncbi:MAG: phenylalanine--tRNA ligase subunit beta [Candidatus Magasanikbacteria bacterium CG_4_10_14_0_2_um_filter_37_12]|uniref:Phenylalanine--tRNA ligase beta subunit n=1 Tax=Candidatus Magasanikbacteria bacterium CG_4_10_14_0_2_um_filter_37_12 TaxID=1974637 RepID=A0A2M7V9K5_9BACT|nr:MAG: phenylalanine--tRNA ligase subunit beta [Candidatus Magasanikbacteria bacterium CG_4_10_14_0_2_um_filter_37_12]
MLISKQWLQDFVEIPKTVSSEELSDLLTMRVVEIEGVEEKGKMLDNIVVGEIKKLESHPNADKLKLCIVSDGKEDYKVVCGGSNLKEGMKVAFGKVGAKVRWHGEGDLIELKKAKIRGEDSLGMICAPIEIGFGEMFPVKDEAEILDLSDRDVKTGTPLAKAFGFDDVVFDIDNKSMTHRPDLWGHYGMAREISAVLEEKLKPFEPPTIVTGSEIKLTVDNQAVDSCLRFTGVVLDGIAIVPSPQWMQKRLLSIGVRPINNLVDITNYVMYEIGQPTHVYDVDRLESNSDNEKHILIRKAKNGEEFITLDGGVHELTSEMFVIADDQKAVLMGGIMGGKNSEVTNNTTRVLFESANFDATTVRKMSQALGLRTDGSARWEKTQDPTNAELGLRRLVELTLQICPGVKVVSNVADSSHYKINQGPIKFDLAFLAEKMGIEIPKKQVLDILGRLGFGIEDQGTSLLVTIPTWRATKDISIPEDLVEEVTRLYGFGNIPTTMPSFEIRPAKKNLLRELEHNMKEVLVLEYGLTEVYNYSFESPAWLEKLGEDVDKHLELDNPLAKDKPLARRLLLGNMLENVESNLHRYEVVNIFETGRVFYSEEQGAYLDNNNKEYLPKEETLLAIVYSAKRDSTPFYNVSSTFFGMMNRLGIDVVFKKQKPSHKLFHPGRFAEILVADIVIGYMGEIHPSVQNNVGIANKVAVLEISLNKLFPLVVERRNYVPLPQFPAVLRDIAFLVDTSVVHDDVVAEIKNVDALIRSVELFDVFFPSASAKEKTKLGESKKSMAYHIVYQSNEKTLEASEIDIVHEKVLLALQKKFEAEVRE